MNRRQWISRAGGWLALTLLPIAATAAERYCNNGVALAFVADGSALPALRS